MNEKASKTQRVNTAKLAAKEYSTFQEREVGITDRYYNEYQCGSCGVKYAESNPGFDPTIQCWCQGTKPPMIKTFCGLDGTGCECYKYQCGGCGRVDNGSLYPKLQCYCRPDARGPVIKTVRHGQFAHAKVAAN